MKRSNPLIAYAYTYVHKQDVAVLRVEAPKDTLRPIPVGASNNLRVRRFSRSSTSPFYEGCYREICETLEYRLVLRLALIHTSTHHHNTLKLFHTKTKPTTGGPVRARHREPLWARSHAHRRRGLGLGSGGPVPQWWVFVGIHASRSRVLFSQ